nr:hypothetical protein [Tanacetum cinerariifolium]
DGITGVNGIIVVTSPRYRYDLLFNLGLSGLIIGLNALLIPRLGLNGAALSNAVALVSINLARTWRSSLGAARAAQYLANTAHARRRAHRDLWPRSTLDRLGTRGICGSAEAKAPPLTTQSSSACT